MRPCAKEQQDKITMLCDDNRWLRSRVKELEAKSNAR